MKGVRLISIFLLIALASMFSGCAQSPAATGKDRVNVLGIVTVEESSYTPVESTSLHVGANELVNRDLPSGKRVSLLWGLITYTDY